jgi:hypothetical protein
MKEWRYSSVSLDPDSRLSCDQIHTCAALSPVKSPKYQMDRGQIGPPPHRDGPADMKKRQNLHCWDLSVGYRSPYSCPYTD